MNPEAIPFRVNSLEATVAKINTDMYHGAGRANPSITSRLDSLEDRMDRIERNARHTLWLLVTILLTLLADIAKKHL